MAPPTTNTPTTSTIEPLKVILGIVSNQMGLAASQWATANQDYAIPPAGLFLVGGYLGPTEVIANQSYFDGPTDSEIQEVSVQHMIQLELMSMAPDNSARIRKEEVFLALRSFYALQQADINLLGIAWNPSPFVDASHKEGTVMLNRFVTVVPVNALHRKVIAAGSFDNVLIDLNVAAPGGGQNSVTINPATLPT